MHHFTVNLQLKQSDYFKGVQKRETWSWSIRTLLLDKGYSYIVVNNIFLQEIKHTKIGWHFIWGEHLKGTTMKAISHTYTSITCRKYVPTHVFVYPMHAYFSFILLSTPLPLFFFIFHLHLMKNMPFNLWNEVYFTIKYGCCDPLCPFLFFFEDIAYTRWVNFEAHLLVHSFH